MYIYEHIALPNSFKSFLVLTLVDGLLNPKQVTSVILFNPEN